MGIPVNAGKTLFAQLTEFVPWTSFSCIVTRHAGDSRPMAWEGAGGQVLPSCNRAYCMMARPDPIFFMPHY
ncbi:MAG: hypothetical protein C0492_06875 [Verminephrobacter sp.]|nr:hypothetical protein [Verminephrobacter sp.]